MVASMVRSLIKHNLITKEHNPLDQRSYYLVATATGKQLVDEAIDGYTKTIQTLEAKMGKDQFMTLVNLLNQANQFIGEINE